jgi:hypothetical protein
MPANLAFPYPPLLSKTAWDKNKGVMAKLAVGKTDVGAQLAGIEAEFKKLVAAAVVFPGGTDPIEYLAHEENVLKSVTAAAKTVRGKCVNAGVVLKQAYSDFSKSAVIPKSSTAYIKKIQDAIKPFESDLAAYPERVRTELRNDFKPRMFKTSAYAALKDVSTSFATTYSKVLGMIKSLDGDPTIAAFQAQFKGDGPHRQMTTVCKLWDQLVCKAFPTVAATVYGGKAMSDFAGQPCMMEVANETNEVATKVIRAAMEKGQDEARAVKTYCLKYSSSIIGCQPLVKHIQAAWKHVSAV